MIVRIRCELCTTIIGAIDTDTIQEPLTGAQILSADPARLPAPFHPTLDRLNLRCPMGPRDHQRGHMPFHRVGALWTEHRDWVEFGEPYEPDHLLTPEQRNQRAINNEMPEDAGEYPNLTPEDPESFDRWRDSEEIQIKTTRKIHTVHHEPITCDFCGEPFKHRSSKSRHQKKCKENPANGPDPTKVSGRIDDMRLAQSQG